MLSPMPTNSPSMYKTTWEISHPLEPLHQIQMHLLLSLKPQQVCSPENRKS